jgi:hypothetical protein
VSTWCELSLRNLRDASFLVPQHELVYHKHNPQALI